MIEFNIFWFTMLQVGNYLDYHTTKRFPFGADMEGNPLMVFYSKIRGIPWGETVKEYKIGVALLFTLFLFWANPHMPLFAGMFFGVAMHNELFLKEVGKLNFYQYRRKGKRNTFIKSDILRIKVFLALMAFALLTKNMSDSFGILLFINGLWIASTIVFSFLIVEIISNKITYWRSTS